MLFVAKILVLDLTLLGKNSNIKQATRDDEHDEVDASCTIRPTAATRDSGSIPYSFIFTTTHHQTRSSQ
jgi:hypothetical protein